MKKSIILLAATAALALTGCYQLDLVPYDKPSSTSFWKTEAQCKQGVMGVYAGLKQNDIFGLNFMLDVNSDIGAGYDQYAILQLGTATSQTGIMNNKWKQGYDVIQRVNIAIRNLETAPIAAASKAQLIGETKFLRAMVYFHLLNYFGGLPIYDQTTDLETEYNTLMKPRSSEAEVRAFILQDLTDALASGLPKSWDKDNYGRATEGAIIALRGKVALYDGKYTEAIADFENVIANYGYKLYSSYAGLFDLSGGHTSSEMIFSLVNLGGVGMPYGLPLCFYAGTRNSFGSCWNNTVPNTNLADMYEYKDGRPFDWDAIYPGYNTKGSDGTYWNAVREKVWYSICDDKVEKVTTPSTEVAAIQAMYAARDPRMSATLIMPYTKYEGWASNALKMMDFYFLTKGARDSKTGRYTPVAPSGPQFGLMYNNQGGWETYFWRKFVPTGNWNGAITDRAYTPVNFPLIRLADVHLLLAEAYNKRNQAGDQAKAVENINVVRTRAGMPGINSGPAYLAATSQDEVFTRIFRERGVELAGEGHRDIDLRRWRLSEKYLNQNKFGVTGKVIVLGKFNKDRDYLWPIPLSEIQMNPALAQNPGW